MNKVKKAKENPNEFIEKDIKESEEECCRKTRVRKEN
jgi:hypothetical protein